VLGVGKANEEGEEVGMGRWRRWDRRRALETGEGKQDVMKTAG